MHLNFYLKLTKFDSLKTFNTQHLPESRNGQLGKFLPSDHCHIGHAFS